MGDCREASVMVLKKVRPLAPDSHRHIALARARGVVVKKGDRILVYQVEETVPAGEVLVTGRTVVEFR